MAIQNSYWQATGQQDIDLLCSATIPIDITIIRELKEHKTTSRFQNHINQK